MPHVCAEGLTSTGWWPRHGHPTRTSDAGKTPDGVYIAYQTLGDGPVDIVWQFEWIGNVDYDLGVPAVRGVVPGPGGVLAPNPA